MNHSSLPVLCSPPKGDRASLASDLRGPRRLSTFARRGVTGALLVASLSVVACSDDAATDGTAGGQAGQPSAGGGGGQAGAGAAGAPSAGAGGTAAGMSGSSGHGGAQGPGGAGGSPAGGAPGAGQGGASQAGGGQAGQGGAAAGAGQGGGGQGPGGASGQGGLSGSSGQAGSGGSAGSSKLTWAPPALTAPETIKVTNTKHFLNLKDGKDYVVLLPGAVGNDLQSTPLEADGGLTVQGGRHVVMIGGGIQHKVDYPKLTGDKPDGGTTPTYAQRLRSAYFKDWSGTLHVEGVEFSGDLIFEGINVSSTRPGAIAQFQNIRFADPMHPPYMFSTGAGQHDGGDVLQTWNGPDQLRIDRFTIAGASYQAFWLFPMAYDQPTPTSFTLRRVNVGHIASADYCTDWPTCTEMAHGAWNIFTLAPKGKVPGVMDDFWIVRDKPTPKLISLVAYQANNLMTEGADAQGSYVEWTKDSMLSGKVHEGAPPGGDFVPAGSVGAGYVSPGYL